MANYYLMDKMTMTAFKNKCAEIDDAHEAEEREIRAQLKARYSGGIFCQMYDREVKSIDDLKKIEMNDFLEMLYNVVGTKKAEVCADVCRLCEELGFTEAMIVKPVFDKFAHCYRIDQSWYVCKEDGVWYQKMSEDCKAKHEVKF